MGVGPNRFDQNAVQGSTFQNDVFNHDSVVSATWIHPVFHVKTCCEGRKKNFYAEFHPIKNPLKTQRIYV